MTSRERRRLSSRTSIHELLLFIPATARNAFAIFTLRRLVIPIIGMPRLVKMIRVSSTSFSSRLFLAMIDTCFDFKLQACLHGRPMRANSLFTHALSLVKVSDYALCKSVGEHRSNCIPHLIEAAAFTAFEFKPVGEAL